MSPHREQRGLTQVRPTGAAENVDGVVMAGVGETHSFLPNCKFGTTRPRSGKGVTRGRPTAKNWVPDAVNVFVHIHYVEMIGGAILALELVQLPPFESTRRRP
jgi:hypothetical protein